jgi:hypothetical protein
MNKYILVCLALLFVGGPAFAAECRPLTLEQILDRYVEARGGAAALESQTALRLRSTNHEGKWNPKFDYRTMKPGYMWIRATYDDGEVVEEGFDGERGWEKWTGKPAEYVSGDAGQALQQGAMSPVHLYGLNHMQGLGAAVTLEGCNTIDDRDYFVINVVSRFGSNIDYYVSTDTYRLERSRTVRPLHPTVDPTPITIEERWTDFRFVDGVLHPFGFSLWNIETGEQLSWLEVHSIERDRDATISTFALPTS